MQIRRMNRMALASRSRLQDVMGITSHHIVPFDTDADADADTHATVKGE